jgi:zinc transport system substrate-binding protein
MEVFMKRIFLSLITILVFFCACSRGNAPQDAENKIAVTATIFAPYDFVRAVAGDRVQLAMLLPPGAETHSFEPTPKDIITVQNSNVFLYIGGESDAWVDRILSSMDTSKMQILRLMETVTVVEEEIVEGMEEEEEEEDPLLALGVEAEPEYDEHIWTSPQNAKRIVEVITETLCKADPQNADFYRQNAKDYAAKLEKLDNAFREVVQNGKRETIVFGDRFPFRYFTDAYGLSYFAAFPGCSTETEPSAATVAFLIDKINSEKIPVVFHIELSNERMADTISEATGAKKMLLHACHNITKKDFESGLSYLDVMTANVENLKEALR